VNKAAEVLRLDWFDIPIMLVLMWGWIRWARSTQPKTAYSILSLIGFMLATLSGVLAISSMFYAYKIGGFPYYDRRLLRIYSWGGLLSLAGIISALVGLRKPNALRWHALCFSLIMFFFWFASASGE
jgi:hypothetical protein